MNRSHDQCERYAETAFGKGECAFLANRLIAIYTVESTVTVQGDGDASKCPYFKKLENEDNE